MVGIKRKVDAQSQPAHQRSKSKRTTKKAKRASVDLDPTKPPRLPSELQFAILDTLLRFYDDQQPISMHWLNQSAQKWIWQILQVNRETRAEGLRILLGKNDFEILSGSRAPFSLPRPHSKTFASMERTQLVAIDTPHGNTVYVGLPFPATSGEALVIQPVPEGDIFFYAGNGLTGPLQSKKLYRLAKVDVLTNSAILADMLHKASFHLDDGEGPYYAEYSRITGAVEILTTKHLKNLDSLELRFGGTLHNISKEWIVTYSISRDFRVNANSFEVITKDEELKRYFTDAALVYRD